MATQKAAAHAMITAANNRGSPIMLHPLRSVNQVHCLPRRRCWHGQWQRLRLWGEVWHTSPTLFNSTPATASSMMLSDICRSASLSSWYAACMKLSIIWCHVKPHQTPFALQMACALSSGIHQQVRSWHQSHMAATTRTPSWNKTHHTSGSRATMIAIACMGRKCLCW